MTSVSLFQFSLCFKAHNAAEVRRFVCLFFGYFAAHSPQIAHASKTVELQARLSLK